MALIEREHEVGAGREIIDAARGGHGGALLVEGPAGIGKSSLLAAVRELAADAGLALLAAQGRDLEQGFGFGAALQLLEPPLSLLDSTEREAVFVGAAALARPLLGDRRELRREPGAGADDFALIHGLFWVLSTLAERSPLAVVVDDAHWSDAPTLRFLTYLAHRVRDLPVALVVARRTGEPVSDATLDSLFQRPEVTPMRLGPLTIAGVRQVVDAEFPHAAEELARVCHEVSGGNPFLLRELLRELAEVADADPAVAGRVGEFAPRSVTLATLTRIARLPAPSSALARGVAVLGDDCPLQLAARIAGTDLDLAGRMADALTAAEILRPGADLAFAHPLLRTAVYEEIPRHERGLMHQRAAELLLEDGASPERVVSQLLLAPPSGQPWAVEALREAAASALERGAPDSAVVCLRRALDEGPPAELRAEVLVELGEAEARVGEATAPARLEEALRHESEPRRRVEVLHLLGRVLQQAGSFAEAAQAFERGLAEHADRNGDLRRELEAGYIAAARLDVSTRPAALERLDALRRRTEPEGGPLDRMLFATLAFEGAMAGDRRDEPIAFARRALRSGAPAAESEWIGFYSAVSALGYADELVDTERLLSRAVTGARRRGSIVGLARASGFRAFAYYRLGRVADAIADATAALEHAVGAAVGGPATNAVLAEAMMDRGDLDAAARALDFCGLDAWTSSAPYAYYLAARARLGALRGEPERGLAEFLECGRLLQRLRAPNPAVIPWRSEAALLAASSGRSDARDLIREELELASRFGAPRAIGLALRAQGVLDRDADRLAEAVRYLSRSHARLDAARALTDLGAVLRTAGQSRDAREYLRLALETSLRCGAPALAERARSELRAAGAKPRRDRLTGPDALTPSELRVARMAAEGLTNREIAESLFVTVKAVQWHLGNVYRKLEIGSRAQLGEALGE